MKSFSFLKSIPLLKYCFPPQFPFKRNLGKTGCTGKCILLAYFDAGRDATQANSTQNMCMQPTLFFQEARISGLSIQIF